MEGGPGFFSPAFVAAGSRELLSGIGGSGSLRLFGEEDGDLEEGGTRCFPLGDV
jgi:hypothetical protein